MSGISLNLRQKRLALLASYLLVGAVTLRGLLENPAERELTAGLLSVYIILMITEPTVSKRLGWFAYLYLTLQIALTAGLYVVLPKEDYWALLLIPSSIYAMHNFSQRTGFIWVSIMSFVVVVMLLYTLDLPSALPLMLIYSSAYLFVASYVLALKQTEAARQESQSLLTQLQQANRQLEAYAERAEALAVMEERNRLARELHDSITQSLYSLTLLAAGFRRFVRDGNLENLEEALTDISEVAQQALKEMRMLIYELRPPALAKEGLLGALHHRLGAVEKRAGVEARLVVEEVVELPAVIEEALYHIATEALNNALKHASATSVRVQVCASYGRVELEVIDNGRGFNTRMTGQSRGMGLHNMRERIEKLGGTLTILSSLGEGTRVKASAPIQASP